LKDPDSGGWISTRALLDSGSQGNCVNQELSEDYLTTREAKSNPITMIMADGNRSPAGPITHYNPVALRIASNEEQIGLDVAPLSHEIILGIPWHKKHNPKIDYPKDQLTFLSEFCRHNCSHYGRTVPLHPNSMIPNIDPENETPTRKTPEPDITTEARKKDKIRKIHKAQKKGGRRRKNNIWKKDKVRETPRLEGGSRPKSVDPPQVALIGAAAFAYVCNQPETELFFLSVSEMERLITKEEADPDLSAIPLEYHEFADLFSKKEADKLPPHQPYDHKIPLEPGSAPPFGPIYKLSPIELETLRKYVEENLRKGFIRNSQSPCGAPIVFAKKKDGTLRICVDYRGLNKITIKNRYPLPLIGELMDRISNAKRFTKLDVRDGYNRLRMAPGEEWKTAFRCRYGLYEYTVMPFGLCNAPGTFQHYMNDTFREFLDDFMVVYLDDILIFSKDMKEHKRHVRQVLERLREAGLFLKTSKCQFHVEEVEFLGFIIGNNGVRMDPSKVEAITSWPTPESPQDIRMFLGLANFYRRFIKNFSKIALPLTRLLKKENARRFRWDKVAKEAFDYLRKAFTTAPILRHFDPSLPVVLEADASDYALGAVVSQRAPDGRLHPVAFHSRKFNPAELNYEIYDNVINHVRKLG